VPGFKHVFDKTIKNGFQFCQECSTVALVGRRRLLVFVRSAPGSSCEGIERVQTTDFARWVDVFVRTIHDGDQLGIMLEKKARG
jgi:hypothetical protein